MTLLFQLLGVIALIAAVAPVAMAGGGMIAAFMSRRHIVAWTGITVGTILALIGGGLIALQIAKPMLGETYGPLSVLLIVVPPWAVFWLGRKHMNKLLDQKPQDK